MYGLGDAKIIKILHLLIIKSAKKYYPCRIFYFLKAANEYWVYENPSIYGFLTILARNLCDTSYFQRISSTETCKVLGVTATRWSIR